MTAVPIFESIRKAKQPNLRRMHVAVSDQKRTAPKPKPTKQKQVIINNNVSTHMHANLLTSHPDDLINILRRIQQSLRLCQVFCTYAHVSRELTGIRGAQQTP